MRAARATPGHCWLRHVRHRRDEPDPRPRGLLRARGAPQAAAPHHLGLPPALHTPGELRATRIPSQMSVGNRFPDELYIMSSVKQRSIFPQLK